MEAIFNPSTLGAVKNVGIPVAVLVGVLAVFSAIAFLRGKIERSVLLSIVGFAAITVACLMFIFWVSTKEVYRWIDTKAVADWAGNDEGWTDGREPLPEYCDRSREGNIATCWSNRPEGYPINPPPMFKGTVGNGAWCTYKLKERILFSRADGNALGRVYICGRVSL
jgi:energy-coupling factor transporter transmembrane protein EcfT